MKSIFQDWKANEGNPKGRLVTILFRLAFALRQGPKVLLPITILYGIFYRVFVEWILGIELPWKTHIGPGLRIDHGQALVVHDGAIIGRDCRLRHCVTIGIKVNPDGTAGRSAVIGDGVSIGPHTVIMGPLTIGDHALIGAGSVVVKDVPPNAIVAGNPARVLKIVE